MKEKEYRCLYLRNWFISVGPYMAIGIVVAIFFPTPDLWWMYVLYFALVNNLYICDFAQFITRWLKRRWSR